MNTPLLVFAALAAVVSSPAQTAALARLEQSPRHHEWVEIPSHGRTLHAFVVYPEVKDPALAVLVIHENRGLTDWVRAVADRLAEAGYVAIAPDMLSGAGPSAGRTKDFASSDEARNAIGQLKADAVLADLQAAAQFVRQLPAANGDLAVVGFCWGGSQTWRLALSGEKLVLAAPFYGTAPAGADFSKLTSAVHGFYGGNDARVNATLEQTAAGMTAAGKSFAPVLYEGAGHAYLRAAEEKDAAAPNRAAALNDDRCRQRPVSPLSKPVGKRSRPTPVQSPRLAATRKIPCASSCRSLSTLSPDRFSRSRRRLPPGRTRHSSRS